nr:RRXRR domain-containing protein [Virgibacillus sp. NKC19-16]
MPCKPRKARLLLREKKAKIVSRNPFGIQLLYKTNHYTQEVNIGVDLGAKHVGIAITNEDKVLAKGELELRQDVKADIDTRRTTDTPGETGKHVIESLAFKIAAGRKDGYHRVSRAGWKIPSFGSTSFTILCQILR